MGKSPEEMMPGGDSIDKKPQVFEDAHEAAAEGSENPIDPVKHALAEANALKEQISQRMTEQKIDIEKKIGDREALIGVARQLTDSLQKAHELLDYLSALEKAGQIKNEQDAVKLAEVRGLVESLEKQRNDIDQKIALLSDIPDVNAELVDRAQQENMVENAKHECESFDKEMDQEADAYAKALYEVSISQSKQSNEGREKEALAREDFRKKWEPFREKIQVMGHSLEPTIREQLRKLYDLMSYNAPAGADAINSFFSQVQEMRSSLGMFKGKEKAALDLLVSNRQLFDESDALKVEARRQDDLRYEAKSNNELRLAQMEIDGENKEKAFRQSICDRFADKDQRSKLFELMGRSFGNKVVDRTSTATLPKSASIEEKSRREILHNMSSQIESTIWKLRTPQ